MAQERAFAAGEHRVIGRLKTIIEDQRFERFVVTLILVNAVTLGLETSASVMERAGDLLHAVDRVIVAVFVVEIAARILVYRGAFFRDPWSLFDLFVVAIALVPDTESLSVLRALRILRVLRLVTVVPSLRKVVAGLIGALPGMGAIGLLLVIVFYVFAVIATKLYAETNPELFGTLGHSVYTLFQAMTFDDWSTGIVKPLVEKGHRFAPWFIVTFMALSAFMVLNLFIGVVVTALDEVTAADAPKLTHPAELDQALVARIDALTSELQGLRAQIAARK